EFMDGTAGFDFAAEGLKIAGEGVGDFLGAAAGNRPAFGVGESAENEADGGAGGGVERKHRMGGESGEKTAGFRFAKTPAGEGSGGQERLESEAGEKERMLGKCERAEN